MNNKPLILIVEDEEGISNFISAILTTNDFNVIKSAKGKEAVLLAASRCPDLILLDLGLPDLDGVEVLKTIREWTNIPIIILSARGHEREKVETFELGADDYITKPFGPSEMIARIKTAIRHSHRTLDGSQSANNKLKIRDLEIDYSKRLVTIAGKVIHLTPIEYKIVVLLSNYVSKVLTHDFIIKEIWGPYVPYENELQALRVNMANIRRKLEKNPAEPEYIITDVGVGYRMIDE